MKKQSQTGCLILLVFTFIILILPTFFYHPQPPPPIPEEEVAKIFQEAQKLEQEKGALHLLDAIQKYEEIAKKYPRSQFAPQALLRIAEIYQYRLNKPQEASKYYIRLEQPPYKDMELEIEEGGRKITLTANEIALRRLDEINRNYLTYKMMDALVRFCGKNPSYSYVLAIVLLVILMKVPLLPLTNAQFKHMKKMQDIQPLIVEIQRKYKNDPKRLQKETVELFKEHKVNPFSGCFLTLIQWPIYFLPYFMIRVYAYQFNKVGFLWVKSLAHPDFILFGLYMVTLIASMWLTSPSDPQQKQQSMMMSLMMLFFFIMFFRFLPSAFILYWLLLNVSTTVQQWLIMRKKPIAGVKPAK